VRARGPAADRRLTGDATDDATDDATTTTDDATDA
jgi:hypothetical protein